MSIKVMHLVWESAPYSEGSLLVLLALADWADDSGAAWPSIANLATKARLKPRQTQYVIRKIQADGFLSIDEGGGRGHQHRYQINMGKLKGAENAPFQEIKGAVHDKKRVQSAAKRVQSTTQRVQSSASDPLVDPLEGSDPSMEPPYGGAPFREALAAFEEARRSMRKTLSTSARRLLYRKLAGWDEQVATQALEDSVINRWQGVFEPRRNGNGARAAGKAEASVEAGKEWLAEKQREIDRGRTGNRT